VGSLRCLEVRAAVVDMSQSHTARCPNRCRGREAKDTKKNVSFSADAPKITERVAISWSQMRPGGEKQPPVLGPDWVPVDAALNWQRPGSAQILLSRSLDLLFCPPPLWTWTCRRACEHLSCFVLFPMISLTRPFVALCVMTRIVGLGLESKMNCAARYRQA
jgi:hypothetical protein